MSAALDYGEALTRWLAGAAPIGSEAVPLSAARQRVLALPVRARDALPPFDNSAMDGFALRMGGDALPAGTTLVLGGAQFAGDGPIAHQAEAIEITTGALLPEGFDAVVPVERACRDGNRLRLEEAVRLGQHIRRRGEDVPAGSEVLPAGRWIDAETITMLASLGVAEVAVARRPRVAVISTGEELVDDAAQPLRPGQIRNGNRPGLVARVEAAGAHCVYQATVGDEPDALLAAIAAGEAAGAQIIASSGAVSMGRHDFVPATLARLGANILFHRLRMRPGKPLLAARLPSGTWYAGLPGNPVSAAVGFRFFVEPLLRRMLALPDEQAVALPLHAALPARGELRFHLKARLRAEAGRVTVEVLGGQESFRIAPLLAASCWAIQPAGDRDLDPGDPIEVLPLSHAQPFPFFLPATD